MSDDDDLLAAEHALGLTDASAREASDPAFAAAVDAWRARLDPMLGPERAPPPELWSKIVARLPANDPARRWRFATFAASAAAVLLLGLLVARPAGETPAPPIATAAPARMMVASLMPKQGGGAVSITYDKGQGRMVVNPVGMDAGGKTPELWVIPADGKPRSLGVVPAKAAAAMTVKPEHRVMLSEGVMLAVSLEPEGGSPTGAPTGPVVMTGIMSAV
jgi:anti-sigma-K factor RskA